MWARYTGDTMRSSDFAWLSEHAPELCRRYGGKWIAVRDGKVIGVGDSATEAAEQARTVADDAGFVLEAVESDADVIYGCP
ncbi:MAG: DUF5678 domain-containing protein [Phycisphaerae bacterium]